MLQSKLLSQFAGLNHFFYQKGDSSSYGKATFINQVHGSRVIVIGGKMKNLSEISADGVLTKEKRLVGVKTADCLPILIFDPKNKTVGAIHAGWKGLSGGIAKNIIRKLKSLSSLPQDVFIAIGPYIKSCCYNVPFSRIKVFAKEGIENKLFSRRDKTNWYLDLGKFAKVQLASLGIPFSQIEVSPYCTFCDKNFYSFRREGKNCGRMVSLIGLKND